MPEQALVSFRAIAVFLVELADTQLILYVRVEERALLVCVPAVSLQPIDADLLLGLCLVGALIDGLLDVHHLLDALVLEAIVVRLHGLVVLIPVRSLPFLSVLVVPVVIIVLIALPPVRLLVARPRVLIHICNQIIIS